MSSIAAPRRVTLRLAVAALTLACTLWGRASATPLPGLSLSAASLDPAYTPGVFDYTASLPTYLSGVALLPVRPSVSHRLFDSYRELFPGSTLAAGNGFSAVLRRDGSAVSWGAVPAGIESSLTLATDLVSLSAGQSHVLALRRDGSVATWGTGLAVTEPVPAQAASGIVAVAAGGFHNLALTANGAVLAWGAQNTVPPEAQSGIVAIAAGHTHNLALTASGAVLAWGFNLVGETQVPVAAQSEVIAISAGGSSSLALKRDGSVVAWGAATNNLTAHAAGLRDIVAIASRSGNHFALRADGRVIAWGDSANGLTNPPSAALSGVVALTAGGGHAVALKRDGSLVAWGSSASGLSTPPATATNLATPVSAPRFLAPGVNVAELHVLAPTDNAIRRTPLAAGFLFSAVIQDDGSPALWRNVALGDLTPPPGATDLVALAAGNNHVLALRSNGDLVTWGSDLYGVLNVPAAASGNITAVSAGLYHSLALKTDGGVLAWGYDNFGQATVPVAAQSEVTAIAAGAQFNLALKKNGAVLAWGANASGQSTVPLAAQSGVVAIAAGNNHALALKTNGAVVGWGDNAFGQLNMPALGLPAVAVGAGSGYSAALLSDGSVVVWGNNLAGVLPVPAAARQGVIALSAGPEHLLALKADGSLVTWGNTPGSAPSPLSLLRPAPGGGDTYRVTLSRALPSAALSQLAAGDLPLSPSFVPETTRYTLDAPVTHRALRLTARAEADQIGPIQLSLNGAPRRRLVRGTAFAGSSNNFWGVSSSGAALLIDNPAAPMPADVQLGVESVATNNSSVFMLQNDGSVFAWTPGFPGSALPVPAAVTRDVVAIATDDAQTLALKNDGSVIAWGSDSTLPAAAASGVARIYAAYGRRAAIKTDGTVQTWGSLSAPPVSLATQIVDLALGQNFAAALTSQGAAAVWGGTGAIATVPAEAQSSVVALAAGSGHALALRSDGRVVAWGANGSGQINVPAEAQTEVVAIAATSNRSAALRRDGRVVVWGFGGPALFNLDLAWSLSTPLPLRSGANRIDLRIGAWGAPPRSDAPLAAGNTRNLALHPDGRLVQWRVGASGSLNPLSGATQSGITAVYAGPSAEWALKTDGRLQHISGPTPPSLGSTAPRVVAAAIGGSQLTLLADGSVVPSGSAASTPVPGDVANVVAVAAGLSHFAALRADGRVVCWGPSNSFGELDVPVAARSGVVAIAARRNRTLALKADGSFVQWGQLTGTLSTVPALATDLVAIAAGDFANLALRRDGSTVLWGDASASNNLIPAAAQNDVAAITAGARHHVVLKHDGTLFAWGLDNSGNPALPPTELAPFPHAPERTYTLEATRALPEPGLLSLSTSVGALAPPFAPETTSYSQSVPYGDAELGVTAAAAADSATLRLRLNGAPSIALPPSALPLRLGLNHLALRVTSGGAPLPDFPLAAGANRYLAVSSTGALMQSAVSPSAPSLPALPAGTGIGIAGVFSGGYGEYALTVDGALGVLSGAAVPDAAQPTSPTHGFTRPRGVSLAVGQSHALLLRADGSLVTWGSSSTNGLLTIPADAQTGVVAVAAGANHSVALRADGRVVAWGSNGSGESTVPAGLHSDIVAIAAYGQRNLALRADGLVIPWGAVHFLADTPPLASQSGVVAIAAGQYANLALKADGSVVCWGNDPNPAYLTPPAAAQSDVVAIACGPRHQVALKSDGTLVAWGALASGASPVVPPAFPAPLVDAPVRDYHLRVERLAPPAALSALSLAAPGVGALSPAFDPLTETYTTSAATPYAGATLRGVAFAPGAVFSVRNSAAAPFSPRLPGQTFAPFLGGGAFLRADGSIASWNALTPPSGTGFISLATGWNHGLALRADGSVSAWGANNAGAASVPPQLKAVAISAGGDVSAAVATNGAPLVWGEVAGGNLRNIPAEAHGLVSIAANAHTIVALRRDGRAVSWGLVGSAPTDAQSGVVAVAAGPIYALALRADGRVVGWGSSSVAQTIPATATYGVVAISAGGSHALALKADGSVVAWGTSHTGATLVPPSALSDVLAIQAGSSSSQALKADGSLVVWGNASMPPSDIQGQTALPLDARLPLALGANTLELRLEAAEPATARTYSVALERVAAPVLALAAGSDTSLPNRQPDGLGQFSFGLQRVGATTAALPFTVLNAGSADLTLTATSFTGASAAEFTLGGLTLPATLAPGATASFQLSATPSATGNRSATLRLHANLPHGGPHHLPLLATGVTHASELTTWRSTRFTSAELGNTALEATVWGDLADPDGDGIPNLLEYALNTDPRVAGQLPAAVLDTSEPAAPRLALTYTRVKRAATAGLVYRVEWSDTLAADSWSALDVTEEITASNATTETVTASVPAEGPRRFLRLRVIAP